MIELVGILAQKTSPAPQQPGPMSLMFPALMLAMLVFFLLSARSQRKREKKQREELHANLAKNNRVLTLGGIIGTIVSVKDDEVVLKVDESTNTKMTIIKSAIQRVLNDDQNRE